MKNNHFLLGLALGCASGYAASKYLTSESGQKLLENINTIRSDFNNGGVGLNNNDLVDHFNEKTDADRKSTRLNSSHVSISYAVYCLRKKNKIIKIIAIRK